MMFSKPMPELSCRLNAWVTKVTCEWLMGKLTVNDVVIDGGRIGQGHGLYVHRCR